MIMSFNPKKVTIFLFVVKLLMLTHPAFQAPFVSKIPSIGTIRREGPGDGYPKKKIPKFLELMTKLSCKRRDFLITSTRIHG